MCTRYAPGQANPYFPKHKYHGIAVGQNLQPMAACRAHHYVGPAATVERGIASYQLTAEHLWATFQREAENVIKENGAFIADDAERNRRINAAYATLWLADERFQWAGLAAFASKQVGCGLLHARRNGERSRDELRTVVHWAGDNTDAAAISVVPAAVRNGAGFMDERLAFGNKHLFLDIYPLHRFYMERGAEEFSKYLPSRQLIAKRIEWKAGELLKFGFPFAEIRAGFDRVREGNLVESVRALARHEQVDVLQAIMYDDPQMQQALAANQYAWAVGFPSGVYMEIQLTLSAQCKAKDGWTAYFPRQRKAKLWVVDERMTFVYKAATRFDELLRSSQRPFVEASLRRIAAGGGVE